jgi:HD-GYP domain-containing protein (c-di-GMP phosphodiesterase class II)
MERYKPISLLNLLLSLSEAMDLAGPEIVQHQQRTAFIAWELGRAAKLPEARLEQLFYAALLHDMGALSVEEKYSILHA